MLAAPSLRKMTNNKSAKFETVTACFAPFVWVHEWISIQMHPTEILQAVAVKGLRLNLSFYGNNVHKNPPPTPPKWAILITFVFMFVTYKKAIYAPPPPPPPPPHLPPQNTLLHAVSVNIRSEPFAHLDIFILNAVWDIPHSFDACSGLPLTAGFYVTGKRLSCRILFFSVYTVAIYQSWNLEWTSRNIINVAQIDLVCKVSGTVRSMLNKLTHS